MKTVIFGVVMLLSQLGTQAAPSCAPGSLQSYFDLGLTGCELGSRLFSNFRPGQVPPFPTMDLAVVNVTPGGTSLHPDLVFTPNYSAGPGQELGLLFQFVVTGTLAGVTLQFNSPMTTGDGQVWAYLDVCPGSLYSPYAPFDCATGYLPYLSGGSGKLQDSMTLPNAGFYDVSLHLYLNGSIGQGGTASLNSVSISLDTVDTMPEPAAMTLVLAGLAAIGVRAWKHRSERSLPQAH